MAYDTAIINAVSNGSQPIYLAGARSAHVEVNNQVMIHKWDGGEYTDAFRAKNYMVAYNMAKLAAAICNNNHFLYSQDYRMTGFNALKNASWNVNAIQSTVYLDCSSLVATCMTYAGIYVDVGGFVTSIEPELINNTGMFTLVVAGKSMSPNVAGLKIGDILRRNGHTEIVVGIGNNILGGQTDDYFGGGVSEVHYSLMAGSGISQKTSEKTLIGVNYTNITSYGYSYTYETKTEEYVVDEFVSSNQEEDTLNTGLLTYPTLVESPFIQFTVGDYTFGTYKKVGNKYSVPNYINALHIKKINGEVNKYTITIIHQILAGSDPNFVDKIFSKARYGAVVHLTYGDYNAPTMSYKDEEAILLKVTNLVDFGNSRITYTVECTSNATKLYSDFYDFTDASYTGVHKPSDIIADMLWGSGSSKYKLTDIFTGMRSKTACTRYNLLATDDVPVEIMPLKGMDPLNYLNYLVSCMCSTGNDAESPLKNATYKMAIFDETNSNSELGGTYFRIKKITTSDGRNTSLAGSDIYEVDVGYPTDNLVINFLVKTDQTWSMLYEYSGDNKEFIYNIDSDGNLNTLYVPRLAVSKSANKMTEKQRDWWTNMTKFPISAELTIKGLIRPAVLMSYVRINALFYGLRHITSGLYFITAEEDDIDSNGYRTTLSLTRIAGDDEYIKSVKKTRTVNLPTAIVAHMEKEKKQTSVEITHDEVIDSGYEYGYTTGGGTFGISGSVSSGSSGGFSYYDDRDSAENQTLVGKITAACLGLICYGLETTSDVKKMLFSTTNNNILEWIISYFMNRYEYQRSLGLSSALSSTLGEWISAGYLGRWPKEFYLAYTGGKQGGNFTTSSGVKMMVEASAIDMCWNALLNPSRKHNYNMCNRWTEIKKVDNSPEKGFDGVPKSFSDIKNVLKGSDSIITNTSGNKYSGCKQDECIHNMVFGYVKCKNSVTGGTSSGLSSNSPSPLEVWGYLMTLVGNPYGVAGIMGNIWWECQGDSKGNLKYNRVEYMALSRYKDRVGIPYTDDSYTLAVDAGMSRNFVGSELDIQRPACGNISLFEFTHMPWATNSDASKWSGTYPYGCNGYGLCQWTTLERKTGLYNLCKSKGVSISNGKVQLEYLIQELRSSTYSTTVLLPLKLATSVALATQIFFENFEKAGDDTLPQRTAQAQVYFNDFNR